MDKATRQYRAYLTNRELMFWIVCGACVAAAILTADGDWLGAAMLAAIAYLAGAVSR